MKISLMASKPVTSAPPADDRRARTVICDGRSEMLTSCPDENKPAGGVNQPGAGAAGRRGRTIGDPVHRDAAGGRISMSPA